MKKMVLKLCGRDFARTETIKFQQDKGIEAGIQTEDVAMNSSYKHDAFE